MHTNPTLRILQLLKSHRRKVAFLVLLVVLAAGFDITVPFITKTLIDTLTNFLKHGGAAPIKTLLAAAAGILAATVLKLTPLKGIDRNSAFCYREAI